MALLYPAAGTLQASVDGVAGSAGCSSPPVAAANFREMERVKGIEPSSSAWKAVALPLSYTRKLVVGQMVEGVGFEPT